MSRFFLLSLLLILGQTSAFVSVDQRNTINIKKKTLYLCPGEGKLLVDAFNQAVASSAINPEQDLNKAAAELLQVGGAASAVAKTTGGFFVRIRNALWSSTTTNAEQQEALP